MESNFMGGSSDDLQTPFEKVSLTRKNFQIPLPSDTIVCLLTQPSSIP